MPNRRIVMSTGLAGMVLLLAVAAGLVFPKPREIRVPIDRSALEIPAHNNPTSIMAHAPAKNEIVTRSLALASAPDPRLIETTPIGLLPRKSDQGDRPADIYARPFDRVNTISGRPKLSLVIARAGISETMTAEAYLALPPDISFVLSPYAHDAERQMRDIRNRGHEVFLGIVSVTDAASREDRGPHALDQAKDHEQNRAHLLWAMSRFTGYVGLVADMTEKSGRSPMIGDLLGRETTARGLSLLTILRPDSRTLDIAPDPMPAEAKFSKVYLPGQRPSELAPALSRLMQHLRDTDHAVALIDPAPFALDMLKDWIVKHASHEFDLVPLSALMRSEGQG